MATKKQKIKVGLFILLSAAIFIGGLALVAGFRGGEQVEYEVVFEGSVLGLSEGGLVQYGGVEIGRVGDVQLGEDQRAHVTMLIDPTEITLYRGVDAKLEMYSFATGTMCVALTGGDPSEGPHPPSEPIIASASLVESFSNQFASVLDDLNGIMQEIKTGLEGMESGALTKTVEETRLTITELRSTTEEARKVFAEVSERIGPVAEKFDARLDDLGTGIDNWNELAGETTKLARSADETLGIVREKIEPVDVAKIIDELENAVLEATRRLEDVAATVDTASETVVYQADNVQYSVTETMRTLEVTLQSMRDLVDYVRDNPSALIRGKGPVNE